MPTGQNAKKFLTTDRNFFTKISGLPRKEFSTILENFTEIFSLLRIAVLQYFIPYFTITPKKWTVSHL